MTTQHMVDGSAGPKKDTRYFVFLGAGGAGKTTTIKHLVEHSYNEGKRVAVICNDDGDPDANDIPPGLRRYADVEYMTDGCFGCSDRDKFLDRLGDLHGTVDLVLIECIAFMAPEEIQTVFGILGFTPTFVALVDAINYLDAQAQFGTVIPQISAADAILVTKADDGNREAVMEYIGGYCSIGVPVIEHGVDEVFDVHPFAHAHCDHDGHHHHHNHEEHNHHHDHEGAHSGCEHDGPHSHCEHHHHHDHDGHDDPPHNHWHLPSRNFRIYEDVTAQQVREYADAQKGCVRCKGVAVGTDGRFVKYEMTYGRWTFEPAASDALCHVIFYTVTQDQADALQARFLDLSPSLLYASEGTADLVRAQVYDRQVLLDLVDKCRSTPLKLHPTTGCPITATTAGEGLNEVRKRKTEEGDDIPDADRKLAISTRVWHFLRCADWYLANLHKLADAHPDSIYLMVVGMVWFVSQQPQFVDDELIQRVRQMPIAFWLATALLGRSKVNGHDNREEVIADESGITAAFGLGLPGVDDTIRALLQDAYQHNVALAEAYEPRARVAYDKPRVIEAWRDVASQFA